jgi:hypothetical protein
MEFWRSTANEPFAVVGGDGDEREGGAGDTAPLDSVFAVSPCVCVCGKEAGVAVRYGNINQCQSCIEATAHALSLQHVCLRRLGGLQLEQLSMSRNT